MPTIDITNTAIRSRPLARPRRKRLQVDVEYTVGRQVRRRRDVQIGRMPIMLRSNACVLHNASDAELIACNECPLDPGGYFVVRGTEKVILIQEQLSKNRMLVEKDSDGDFTAFVTSTDAERKTMTRIKHKKGIFLLAHSIFEKPVNLAIVFKALGIESDQVAHPCGCCAAWGCRVRAHAAVPLKQQQHQCGCRSCASWWVQASATQRFCCQRCTTQQLKAS
jgi:DNA-directed RNA polymerase III subunit RPC2